MTMVIQSMQSSELSRNPKAMLSAAEERPILVTRRDGENLILMSQRESDARNKLFDVAADFFSALSEQEGSIAERLSKRFHWMLALSQENQTECADDLMEGIRVALATRNMAPLAIKLDAWRDSAMAIAAGYADRQIEWLDNPVKVSRP